MCVTAGNGSILFYISLPNVAPVWFVTVCVSIYLPILLETSKEVILVPVPVEVWQAEHLRAPKPFYWPADQVTQLLDIAEGSMYVCISI